MDISVVLPLYNEADSLPELLEWIEKIMVSHDFSYEVICVDDGSSDDSWRVIRDYSARNKNVKGIRFRRNYGKAAALSDGFNAAMGNVVITMDSDLQDSPDEIPELYNMVIKDKFDLVSGWKKKRYDPLSKTIPTKLFNWVTRRISGINLHDFNCGLKAYRKEVVKSIELHGEMHRYIPVIAKWAGFGKIGEKVVKHQERKYGVSKFGIERFFNGFLDLLTIIFISRFGKRPMHLFGLFGILTLIAGGAVTIQLIYEKISALAKGLHPRDVTDQPLFYIALVAIVIGVQLFLAGFLAEMITRSSSERNKHLIGDKIGSLDNTLI